MLAHGDKTFVFDNIVVRPKAVLLDSRRSLLAVIERANSSYTNPPSALDQLAAQISARTVHGMIEQVHQERLALRVYLAYPGCIQIELQAKMAETAEMIRAYHERQQRRSDLKKADGCISQTPGPVLAYVLASRAAAPCAVKELHHD